MGLLVKAYNLCLVRLWREVGRDESGPRLAAAERNVDTILDAILAYVPSDASEFAVKLEFLRQHVRRHTDAEQDADRVFAVLSCDVTALLSYQGAGATDDAAGQEDEVNVLGSRNSVSGANNEASGE